MNTDIAAVANAARPIFEKLKSTPERTHMNQFLAIEPTFGEYFAADTLSEAIGASRRKFPNRLAHTFRVGHQTVLVWGSAMRSQLPIGRRNSPEITSVFEKWNQLVILAENFL